MLLTIQSLQRVVLGLLNLNWKRGNALIVPKCSPPVWVLLPGTVRGAGKRETLPLVYKMH